MSVVPDSHVAKKPVFAEEEKDEPLEQADFKSAVDDSLMAGIMGAADNLGQHVPEPGADLGDFGQE